MPETVTIQISDGQTFTATPDSERWIMLPSGAKPAEPWWSECQAQFGGDGIEGKFHGLIHPCRSWDWGGLSWFRIRPTEGRSWSDIALKQQAEPAVTVSSEQVQSLLVSQPALKELGLQHEIGELKMDVSDLTAERDALLAVLRIVNVSICTDANGKIALVQHDGWKVTEKEDVPALLLARTVMEREGGAA